MRIEEEILQLRTRRYFLKDSAVGLGAAAMASLLSGDGVAAVAGGTNPLASREPHFPAKAKQVIYLHMTGSPPNLDLFDYKPELNRRSGEDCPQQFLEGKR